MIRFLVNGRPVGQAAISYNKYGHGYYPNNKTLMPWRNHIAIRAKEAMRNTKDLYDGAVIVIMMFYVPRGKTVKREYPIVSPDIQHLVRAAEDAMTGVVYTDDARIVDTVVSMRYDGEHEEGVEIGVVELEPNSEALASLYLRQFEGS